MTFKHSTTTALMGCIVLLIALGMIIWNTYFSTQPNPIRAENLIDTIYIFATSALFFLMATYFDHTGR